ncbi:MAG: peptidase [Candidatus Aminicenantes bacterium]|nr:peptidase [Candidatus Aminicenantes bacterium]
MFFWDATIFLLIPPLLLAVYAQYKVKSTFQSFSQKRAHSRISGAEVAKEILDRSGVRGVSIEKVSGKLSDHYDPRKKTLRLSENVHSSDSIAALGVAAHETGHAIQHHHRYVPLSLRNLIYPVANFGSTLAFPLFFIGFIFSAEGPSILMDIGILLFTVAVAFSVLTLPVEFNASKRAVRFLHQGTYLNQEEIKGARKVLSAAALTYVASTAMAIMQLLRLLILRDRR